MRRVSPLERIRLFGRAGLNVVAALGRLTLLLGHVLLGQRTPGIELHPLVKQFYSVGVLPLATIIVSGLFICVVLALQGYNILISYDSEQAVGQMVTLILLRELGLVVTGPLFVGRAGSTLTAETGNMKATEQLPGLEMTGVDPLKYIVMPRLRVGFISIPLLAAIFSAVGIQDGAIVAVDWLGIYERSPWANMQNSAQFTEDVPDGVIKSIMFVFVVTQIAVYQGYDYEPTSEGISWATTRTVVYVSLTVLGFDFVLTALIFGDF